MIETEIPELIKDVSGLNERFELKTINEFGDSWSYQQKKSNIVSIVYLLSRSAIAVITMSYKWLTNRLTILTTKFKRNSNINPLNKWVKMFAFKIVWTRFIWKKNSRIFIHDKFGACVYIVKCNILQLKDKEFA